MKFIRIAFQFVKIYIQHLSNGALKNSLILKETISTTPFINRSQDLTAGWTMQMAVNIFDTENWCNIPFDNYDFENN
jgi:hypothetical protein